MTILSRLNADLDLSPASFYGYQAPNGGGYAVALDTASVRISLLGVL